MNKRDARRIERREERQRKLERKLTLDLTAMLAQFLRLHYGNPATGRRSAILDGPVIAKLCAAATLHSLLQASENAGEINPQK